MANEWAKQGINTNAIAPGYIATDNTAPLRADAERNKAILDRIPAARWGEPRDLKGALLELSSGGKRVSLAREGTYSMRAVAGATESTTKPGILEALGGKLQVLISGRGGAGSIRRLLASAFAMQGRQAAALGVLRGGEREDSSAVDMLEASLLLAAGAPEDSLAVIRRAFPPVAPASTILDPARKSLPSIDNGS